MLSEEEIKANRLEFEELLMSTDRNGVSKVIDYLETETDFFTAPASSKYHENYTGGLCEHSLKVFRTFITLQNAFDIDIDYKSIVIMSLLHDVCKVNYYHKDKRNVKIGGSWMSVDYWKVDDSNPIGHGHKSVIMLLKLGLEMTDLEINSIIAHMSCYDKSDLFNPSNVYNKDEMTTWLHNADFIATYNNRKVIE